MPESVTKSFGTNLGRWDWAGDPESPCFLRALVVKLVGAAGQRGRLAMPAVLACAGDRGVSRDLMVALFWPARPKHWWN